jgi:hypothetical protein
MLRRSSDGRRICNNPRSIGVFVPAHLWWTATVPSSQLLGGRRTEAIRTANVTAASPNLVFMGETVLAVMPKAPVRLFNLGFFADAALRVQPIFFLV